MFVSMHELLIGQFLHLFLVYFGLFFVLVLINFHVSNVFVKKEKNDHFDTSPLPPLYVQEFQISNWKQSSEEFWGPELGKVWNLV